ncbi:hypothetical protein RhiJN_27433 [Ceratobasidium sp. AG-Ba]|nr:hypothetical protein RhiJN_27433 [Ceratobasidium sp. AG-Ba]
MSGVTAQITTFYKNLLKDESVRAIVNKVNTHFPRSPFIAIVIGTGAQSGAGTFFLLPLIPGFNTASSLASLAQSAIRGQPISVNKIPDILRDLRATGLGLPGVVVGTISDDKVKSAQAVEIGTKEKVKDVEEAEKLNLCDKGEDSIGWEEAVFLEEYRMMRDDDNGVFVWSEPVRAKL